MKQAFYSTSTQDSLLKALGPFRIQTTAEVYRVVARQNAIDFSPTIVVGELQYFGETLESEEEDNKEELEIY